MGMQNGENAQLNYCYNCMQPLDEDINICPYCGHDNTVRQNMNNTLPEGTILNGRYLIGRVIGQGGFGITYLGVDVKLKVVRVAIKEYFPSGLCVRIPDTIRITAATEKIREDFQKGCQEFQNEAISLARFNSPNIVHVRDYFPENGTAYIVMDYIDGKTLTEETAANGGKLPWQRTLNLFKPLILELDQLHQQHLIHRDIKPDNLKIEVNKNGEEHLILLDFGSARSFISAEITKTYTAMVTHGYAPFEQYSPKSRQGPYTDVYALCASMYAVISGVIPPAATDRIEGESELRPIRSMVIDLPEQVEKALIHGLAVKKSDRPQTMKELYEELFGKPVRDETPSIQEQVINEEPHPAAPVPNELPSEQPADSNQVSYPARPVLPETDTPPIASETLPLYSPAEILPSNKVQVSQAANSRNALPKKSAERRKSILTIKSISIMLVIVDIALCILSSLIVRMF